jgi:hypothetical protein
MKDIRLSRFFSRSILLVLLTSAFICSSAQDQQVNKNFKPRSGQAGKDVVWVPTPQALVDKMLDIANVTSQDFLIDLGSGDGRTVISAAKRGARARGIEFNPSMVELSRKNAADEGVSDKTEFIQGDLFEADLSEATVITMFLLSSINLRLRPTLLELKPGTRIVSNTFDMEEWEPDETATLTNNCDSWCDALMWIVPAKVEGTWKFANGSLTLNQKFQMVSGTLKKGSGTTVITNGRLRGDVLTFTTNSEKYSGRVNGNNIEGTVVTGQNNSRWTATLVRD